MTSSGQWAVNRNAMCRFWAEAVKSQCDSLVSLLVALAARRCGERGRRLPTSEAEDSGETMLFLCKPRWVGSVDDYSMAGVSWLT